MVKAFPLGGKDYGHLDLYFKLNSSLIMAAWDGDAEGNCFQEGFKIENAMLISVGRYSSARREGESCLQPYDDSSRPNLDARGHDDVSLGECEGYIVEWNDVSSRTTDGGRQRLFFRNQISDWVMDFGNLSNLVTVQGQGIYKTIY